MQSMASLMSTTNNNDIATLEDFDEDEEKESKSTILCSEAGSMTPRLSCFPRCVSFKGFVELFDRKLDTLFELSCRYNSIN